MRGVERGHGADAAARKQRYDRSVRAVRGQPADAPGYVGKRPADARRAAPSRSPRTARREMVPAKVSPFNLAQF